MNFIILKKMKKQLSEKKNKSQEEVELLEELNLLENILNAKFDLDYQESFTTKSLVPPSGACPCCGNKY